MIFTNFCCLDTSKYFKPSLKFYENSFQRYLFFKTNKRAGWNKSKHGGIFPQIQYASMLVYQILQSTSTTQREMNSHQVWDIQNLTFFFLKVASLQYKNYFQKLLYTLVRALWKIKMLKIEYLKSGLRYQHQIFTTC